MAQLVRLGREAEMPDLLLAEVVELMMIRNPVNAEAVLQAHVASGAASRAPDMRKGVQRAVRVIRDDLTAFFVLQERLAELRGLPLAVVE